MDPGFTRNNAATIWQSAFLALAPIPIRASIRRSRTVTEVYSRRVQPRASGLGWPQKSAAGSDHWRWRVVVITRK